MTEYRVDSKVDLNLGILPVDHGTHQAIRIAEWIESQWPGIPIIDWLRRSSCAEHSESLPIVLGYVDPDLNQLCGCGALLLDDMDDRPNLNPWLGCLYVLPAVRRKGIARILVQALLTRAKSLGDSHLYLFCHPRLQSFYESEGWRLIENRVYEEEPCVVMEQELK
ncbi:MAG TPA: GNAT family N-acetyltransferase [Anaerolineales bacterium]|nr:GNAT family N-acetyltransferase [Anaerolineales bacterium]